MIKNYIAKNICLMFIIHMYKKLDKISQICNILISKAIVRDLTLYSSAIKKSGNKNVLTMICIILPIIIRRLVLCSLAIALDCAYEYFFKRNTQESDDTRCLEPPWKRDLQTIWWPNNLEGWALSIGPILPLKRTCKLEI